MSWARRRHGDAKQPLDGKRERMLLIHGRDIVEAIEIRDGLKVGLVLDELFGAPMQEPDMGIDPGYDLTVKLQHQTAIPHARHGCCGPKLMLKLRSCASCHGQGPKRWSAGWPRPISCRTASLLGFIFPPSRRPAKRMAVPSQGER